MAIITTKYFAKYTIQVAITLWVTFLHLSNANDDEIDAEEWKSNWDQKRPDPFEISSEHFEILKTVAQDAHNKIFETTTFDTTLSFINFYKESTGSESLAEFLASKPVIMDKLSFNGPAMANMMMDKLKENELLKKLNIGQHLYLISYCVQDMKDSVIKKYMQADYPEPIQCSIEHMAVALELIVDNKEYFMIMNPMALHDRIVVFKKNGVDQHQTGKYYNIRYVVIEVPDSEKVKVTKQVFYVEHPFVSPDLTLKAAIVNSLKKIVRYDINGVGIVGMEFNFMEENPEVKLWHGKTQSDKKELSFYLKDLAWEEAAQPGYGGNSDPKLGLSPPKVTKVGNPWNSDKIVYYHCSTCGKKYGVYSDLHDYPEDRVLCRQGICITRDFIEATGNLLWSEGNKPKGGLLRIIYELQKIWLDTEFMPKYKALKMADVLKKIHAKKEIL